MPNIDEPVQGPAKKAYIEGLTRYKDGDLKSACSFFDKAVEGGIEDFDILYYRGICYLDTGDYEKALPDFEVLVRKDPTKPEFVFRRGVAHYKLGHPSEAMRDLMAVPADYDDFTIRWHYLAILFYQNGEFAEALRSIEKALIKFPTMAKVWFNAGVILSAMNIQDRADLAYETAARIDQRLLNAPRQILQ